MILNVPPSVSPASATSSIIATMRREASGSGHRTGEPSMSSIVTMSGSMPSKPMSTVPIDCVKLRTSTPNWPSGCRAPPPAATRVAVSRADERSSTLRMSVWPYFNAPARSAWPGRSRVITLGSKPSLAAVIWAVQLMWSLFSRTSVTGLPIGTPPRTPLTIRATSVSIFWRPPRPCPPCLRARSRRRSSSLISSPAGKPSITTVSCGPCDSPEVNHLSGMLAMIVRGADTPGRRPDRCGRHVVAELLAHSEARRRRPAGKDSRGHARCRGRGCGDARRQPDREQPARRRSPLHLDRESGLDQLARGGAHHRVPGAVRTSRRRRHHPAPASRDVDPRVRPDAPAAWRTRAAGDLPRSRPAQRHREQYLLARRRQLLGRLPPARHGRAHRRDRDLGRCRTPQAASRGVRDGDALGRRAGGPLRRDRQPGGERRRAGSGARHVDDPGSPRRPHAHLEPRARRRARPVGMRRGRQGYARFEMKNELARDVERVVLFLDVNGERRDLLLPVHKTLLEVLREDMQLTGTKHGCELGECGTCTVLVDGRPELSCLLLPVQLQGRAITTIEGMAHGAELHPLQTAFAELGAAQCGYCTPGILLSARSLLETNAKPSRDEIREALAGNLCRCTGYTKIIEAVELAAGRMK